MYFKCKILAFLVLFWPFNVRACSFSFVAINYVNKVRCDWWVLTEKNGIITGIHCNTHLYLTIKGRLEQNFKNKLYYIMLNIVPLIAKWLLFCSHGRSWSSSYIHHSERTAVHFWGPGSGVSDGRGQTSTEARFQSECHSGFYNYQPLIQQASSLTDWRESMMR